MKIYSGNACFGEYVFEQIGRRRVAMTSPGLPLIRYLCGSMDNPWLKIFIFWSLDLFLDVRPICGRSLPAYGQVFTAHGWATFLKVTFHGLICRYHLAKIISVSKIISKFPFLLLIFDFAHFSIGIGADHILSRFSTSNSYF